MPDKSEKTEPEPSAYSDSAAKKPRNMTPIYMATIAIVFLAIGFVARGGMTGSMVTGNVIAGTQDAVAAKAVNFIQSRLSIGYPGIKVELADVSNYENMTGLYKVDVRITYQGQSQVMPYYATTDGKLMITGITDLNAPMPKMEPQAAPASSEIQKSDKPKVELFVMSFCPYGTQAEQAMAPVAELLGGKADIKVRFIASVGGTLDSVQSLHGTLEGKEDARQLCIAKNYDTGTYWKYLLELNNKCYPISIGGETAEYDACWKNAAANASIDTNKIEKCMSEEGVALIRAESAAAGSYGVGGSPTLMINGVQYNGGRTPEAYKSAICSAFNNAPPECGQTLSAAGVSQPSGGCGA